MKIDKRLTIYFENKKKEKFFRTTEAVHDVYSLAKCNESINTVSDILPRMNSWGSLFYAQANASR